LTELGRAMLPHIEQRYLAAQSARALAEALKRGDIVHLRLGLTNSVPSRLFSDVLNGVRNGGAAKVQTGEMHYFDSRDCELTIRHVIASGALPPAFPAVRIDGDLYWDGGILSNTPVEAVFDDNPRRSGVVFAVHMWAPNGPEPDSVWKVLARQKDLQYASRAATHVARQKQLHKLRHVIRELAAKLPADIAATPEASELASYGCVTRMHVVRLLAPALAGEDHAKDIDFSRTGIKHRWQAGYANTKRVLAQAPWEGEFDPLEGFILHQAEAGQMMFEG